MADSRNGAGNGSRLYEVNIWMWRYGRGQPRRITVAEAELQRKAAISDARRRAADFMERRRDERGEDYYRQPAAGDGAASDFQSVVLYSRLYTILYSTCYIECYITYGDAM